MQISFKKHAPRETRALYITKHAMGNSLFRNASHGGAALAFEIQRALLALGSDVGRGSSDAWDFDHDGFPDLYIVNGMVSGPRAKDKDEDLNSFFWRQVVANSPDEARPSHDYEQGWRRD